jgi:hypothetical protein
LLAATALFALSGLTALADTLILDNGRRLRGTLVSVSRGVVVFDEESPFGRGRRLRIAVDRVEGIDFSDSEVNDESFGAANDVTVTVHANQQWTDSGINVRAGETLRFFGSGVASWGPRRDGPEGKPNSEYNANRPIPDRGAGALIGRIGNHEVFYIGEQASLRARASGRLYLGINDDYLQDNAGSFQVVVERR